MNNKRYAVVKHETVDFNILLFNLHIIKNVN